VPRAAWELWIVVLSRVPLPPQWAEASHVGDAS